MATDDLPTDDNRVPGCLLMAKSCFLETGVSMVHDFSLVKQICVHITGGGLLTFTLTNEWVMDINKDMHADVCQCLLYNSNKPNTRLLSVEYMVTLHLFETLPPKEHHLWHIHEYEVKSGMLIMPSPTGVPNAVWKAAEMVEMRDVIPLCMERFITSGRWIGGVHDLRRLVPIRTCSSY